jgi:RNA polymerase subunit RPABC4/transcription elongation factor Spt4
VTLKPKNPDTPGIAWLKENQESTALISGLLSIVHPQLYKMEKTYMEQLASREDFAELVMSWQSVYNGCQAISNQDTPIHRDNNSQVEWYDMLVTIGPYTGTEIELPGINLQFAYETGTVFPLCRQILHHGVSEGQGDRVCIAYYMRENIQCCLNVKPVGWSLTKFYEN